MDDTSILRHFTICFALQRPCKGEIRQILQKYLKKKGMPSTGFDPIEQECLLFHLTLISLDFPHHGH